MSDKRDIMLSVLAKHSGISVRTCKKVLASLSDVVVATLLTGEDVVFPNLFRVYLMDIPARPAKEKINHLTGKKVSVPAKAATRKIKVRPFPKMKRAVGSEVTERLRSMTPPIKPIDLGAD